MVQVITHHPACIVWVPSSESTHPFFCQWDPDCPLWHGPQLNLAPSWAHELEPIPPFWFCWVWAVTWVWGQQLGFTGATQETISSSEGASCWRVASGGQTWGQGAVLCRWTVGKQSRTTPWGSEELKEPLLKTSNTHRDSWFLEFGIPRAEFDCLAVAIKSSSL
jgi:hypothetical protein